MRIIETGHDELAVQIDDARLRPGQTHHFAATHGRNARPRHGHGRRPRLLGRTRPHPAVLQNQARLRESNRSHTQTK